MCEKKNQIASLDSDANIECATKRRSSGRNPQDDMRLSPNDWEESTATTAISVADADAKGTSGDDDIEESVEEGDEVRNDCGRNQRTPGRCVAARKRYIRCERKGHFLIVCP